ncbi:MAG: gliding motility-associated C-terminal domain-containing protein [Bacteroidota bacterium]
MKSMLSIRLAGQSTFFLVLFALIGGVAGRVSAQAPCSGLTDLTFASDGSGNPLSSGMILTNQLSVAFGITVQAINGSPAQGHPDIAMIFNSAAPTGGDTDLGTPNQAFGGPGQGSGGNPSNNQPLGNLLIISQDGDQGNPNDEAAGGDLILDFANPTYVSNLTLVDIDNHNSELEITHSGAQITTLNLANAGNNSVQTASINQSAVSRIRIALGGSGALAGLKFCNSMNPLTASVAGNDIVCYGDSTWVAATVSGGTAPYSYLWSNGATTSSIYTGAGPWSVTVTDNEGDNVTSGMMVNGPAQALSVNGTVSGFPGGHQISCAGANDGWIDCAASGGYGGYQFQWSNGAQTSDINNLSPGTYTLTVTDLHGCTSVSQHQVTAPAPVQLAVVANDVPCFGEATGSLVPTASGGVAPYSYAVNTNLIGFTGLPAGNYTVTVTDTNGCSAAQNAAINQPAAMLAAAPMVTDVSCFGESSGQIDLQLSGGTSPYQVTQNNQQMDPIVGNLSAGTYDLLIQDQNGCELLQSVTVGGPVAEFAADFVTQDPSCQQADGRIEVLPHGGTGPYFWMHEPSNGESDLVLTGLTSGTHSLALVDAHGCALQMQVDLQTPDAIEITGSTLGPDCEGVGNGFIQVSFNGAAGSPAIAWTKVGTQAVIGQTDSLGGLTAGEYVVTIADDAGSCPVETTFAIPAPLEIDPVVRLESCPGRGDGSIELNIGGGTEPKTVLWDLGLTTDRIDNLAGGLYPVVVADADGCQISRTFALETAPAPVAFAGNDLSLENCTATVPLQAAPLEENATGTWSSPNADLDFTQPHQTGTALSNLVMGAENLAIWTVNREGCTAADTIAVRVICREDKCFAPNMPNLLTPNGDEINDVLVLSPLPEQTQVRIMNRWGNEVFASESYANEWRGRNNAGEELPEGTYFVLVKYCPEDARNFSGFIHLER